MTEHADTGGTPPRPRRRGWVVVVLPLVVYGALLVPLQVSVFRSPFDAHYLDIPQQASVELEHDQTYVLTGDPDHRDDEIKVTVTDPAGSKVKLRTSAHWPFVDNDRSDIFPEDLGTFVAEEDGEYGIRLRGDASNRSVVTLSRSPLAQSSPEAKLHLLGSILALALFVALYIRWRRARQVVTTQPSTRPA